MNLIPLCAFALLSGILLKLSDEMFPRFKPLILTSSGIVFFIFFLGKIAPVWNKFQAVAHGRDDGGMLSFLLKGLGITMLVSVSSSFCRDLGEERVAEKLELCGKGVLLYLSLPLLEYLLNWI